MTEEAAVSTDEVAGEDREEIDESQGAPAGETTLEPGLTTDDDSGEPAVSFEPPKKQTAQERIAEITRKRREAEREAEYWRKVALDKKESAERPPEAKPQPGGRPRSDDYESIEEYEDALLVWHDQRRDAKRVEEERGKQEAAAVEKFNKNAETLRREYEDFDDAINEPVFTPNMRMVLMNAENGPLVAYYLAKNKTVAQKIMSLPPEIQTYELGKIETNLILAKKTNRPTNAPPPIKPVGMGGTPHVDETKMTDDEWYEYHKKQQIAALEQRYKGG